MKLDTTEKRVITLKRISDDKAFPAEIRQYPNRFTDSLEGETITVVWQDSEDGFTNKSTTLTWSENWDWQNETFKCTFTVPEAFTEVAPQTERSVSPIAKKNHKMIVANT